MGSLGVANRKMIIVGGLHFYFHSMQPFDVVCLVGSVLLCGACCVITGVKRAARTEPKSMINLDLQPWETRFTNSHAVNRRYASASSLGMGQRNGTRLVQL